MVLKRRYYQSPVMQPDKRQDITRKNVEKLFVSKDFQATLARRLGGAVQIPAIAYDDMGLVGEDPRWEVFHQFSEYLKKTFSRMCDCLGSRKLLSPG